MASVGSETIKQILSFTECCICMTTYDDPRTLPCLHTFCLKCFEEIQTTNKKHPGDVLPCPLCNKGFEIPQEGMIGLPKSFFMESLLEVTKAEDFKTKVVPCVACNTMKGKSEVTEATTTCLNCREHYCLECSKTHRSPKLAKDHKIVELKSEFTEDEIRDVPSIPKCNIHSDKVLDYYCNNCKTVVCVSCFVEYHRSHDCKDVTTVDKDFRQTIEEKSSRISDYREQMMSRKRDIVKQKQAFMANISMTENAIVSKSQQLKLFIDQQTNDILTELSLIVIRQQKKIDLEVDEIERQLAALESFVTYCSELKSKGSASEVCGCVDSLITRTKELSKESEEYFMVPSETFDVKFTSSVEIVLLQNKDNVIGKLSESSTDIENCAIVIGRNDGDSVHSDVIKINLNRPEEVSPLQSIPSLMRRDAAAAVYGNTIFVTGIGSNRDEIWKFYASATNWKRCASLIQGRRLHSIAFVDHILYICGGWVDSNKITLDDVEVYDIFDDRCSSVGRLVFSVHSSGDCVPSKASLYVFGGFDSNNRLVDKVQVYDTVLSTCTLLSKPMPRPVGFLRAALWENAVILFGWDVCFVYNFEKESFKQRNRFKTGVSHFGLTAISGNIFVIGGGASTTDAEGSRKWIFRDDVKFVPVSNILKDKPIEWKHHAKLPKPSLVPAFGQLNFFV